MDVLLAITLRSLMNHKNWVQYKSILDADMLLNTTAIGIYETLGKMHEKAPVNVTERGLRTRIMAGYKVKQRQRMLDAVDHMMDVEADDLDSAEDSIRAFAARELALKTSGYIMSRVEGPTLDYAHVAELATRAKDVAHGQLSNRVESRDAGLPGDADMVRHVVPLGLHPELDAILDGGIGIGELVLFMAPFGGGKTSYLYRVATNWVQAGEGVLCFTREIPPFKCWNRYHQGLTGLTNTELLMARTLVKARRNQVTGHMWVEDYCSRKLTPDIFKSVGETMLSEEEPLTSVIIDYMQICDPNPSRYHSGHEAISRMVVDFREVANYLGVRLLSAWQVNREGFGKNEFSAKDIALSWDATQHADALIGLNQTREERKRNYLRAILMKGREDPDLPQVELHSDMRRLIIGPWDQRKEAVDANVESRNRSGIRDNRSRAPKRR